MYRPDLTDDIVARVTPGQSGPEVATLLGTPYRTVRFDNLQATAWDYRFLDTWGYWVDLSVMLGDDGRVVNKVLRRIDPSDKP
jgi:outer membrane protein assembly factor BamE (lipoprotein component of BamABCDE complex)